MVIALNVNNVHRRAIMEASEAAASGPAASRGPWRGKQGGKECAHLGLGHELLRRAVVFRSRTSQKRIFVQRRSVERGEGEKSFPGPRDVWGPTISLKNTEKTVPDGFFLTSNMYKIYFRGPRWGSLRLSPRTLVGRSASRSRRVRNEVVIGPRGPR